jgi:very-short-patch-repair endonuclease
MGGVRTGRFRFILSFLPYEVVEGDQAKPGGGGLRALHEMRTGKRTLTAARKLRREMTPPEVHLWQHLRSLGPGYPRFRRQHPVGPYVLDFYCPAAKLVVEVDGWGHNLGDQPARDAARDAWLTSRGFTIVRIPALDVLADPAAIGDGVVRQAIALASPPPPASLPPLPLRRGG